MTETKHEERRWWRTFDEALQRLGLARAGEIVKLRAAVERAEEDREAERAAAEATEEKAWRAWLSQEAEIRELRDTRDRLMARVDEIHRVLRGGDNELAEGAAGRVRADLDKAIADLKTSDTTIAELRTRCATLEAIAEAAKWKAEAQLWASKVRASEADLAESQATWRDAAAKLTSMVRALEAEADDANAKLRGAARDLLAQMGLVLGSDAELTITIKRKDMGHADRSR